MSDTALASRSDEQLSCESDPYATSSDSSTGTSSPLDFYADDSSSSSSSSSATPAFLNATPGPDPEPMECREPDPVSKATPTPGVTPAPKPAPSQPPKKTSVKPGDSRSGKSDAKPKDPSVRGSGGKGSAGGGSPAEKPDSPGAATSGGDARRNGAGGGKGGGKSETEGDGVQRRQQDLTLRRLAMPSATIARGAARIGREPLFLAAPSRTWSAPRALDAPLPEPQPQTSPQRSGPPQAESDPGAARAAYTAVAGQAEALFDRILAAAARVAREADDQLQALTDTIEGQLGLSLVRLEEDQAQRLVEAARGRDAVLERIATRADILRFYVIQQSNGALGRMSALRQDLLTKIGEFGAPVAAAAKTLSAAIAEANKEGTNAGGQLEALSVSRKAEIQASSKFATNDERGAPVIAAMVEAAVEYAGPRIQADLKTLREHWTRVQNFAEPIAACGPCEADGKLTGLRGHAESLGVAGPRAIRSARDGALKSIDQTEQQLGLSVIEAHRQTEDGLTRNHDQTRQMLVAQSGQATLAMRRDVERTGRQQVEALGSVAATQPAAVAMVDREVDKAARTTPTRAAALALQSIARLRRNVTSVSERHPAGVLGMAERNHAARMDRATASGRDMLAMTAKFADQQRKFIGETIDTVTHSIDQTLIEMANVPSQVGQTCDSMIEAAAKAVTEAQTEIPPKMAFIAQKLTDACNGLIPISPDSQPANPDAAGQNQSSGESLMCTPADEPNMTVFDPAVAASQTQATSDGAGGGAGDGKGKAPQPASCDGCDTARTAASDRAAAMAAASAPEGANTSGGETSDAGTTTGDAGDDVGVSSMKTNDRSPNAFREHAEPIGKDGLKAPEVDAFLDQVVSKVERKIGNQVNSAKVAIKKDEATDYVKLMDALRGMNETQAAAFKWSYTKSTGEDLAEQIKANAFNGWFSSWTKTAERRRDAALDRLEGNPGSSVMNELEAAFNFSNDNEVIFATMESLNQAQMKAFVEQNKSRLDELMTELSDADQARFKMLMDRDTVRARSTELKKNVDDVNRKYWNAYTSDDRGVAIGEAFENAEHAKRWVLEAPSNTYDFYELEDAKVKEKRDKAYWAEIQRDFGQLDGVADAIARDNPSKAVSRPDDPPGAMLLAYASRPLSLGQVLPPHQTEGETRDQALARQSREFQQRSNITIEERTGPHGTQRIATTAMSEYQMLALEQSILFGSRSKEARGARALAQFKRRDGKKPDYKVIEKQLHSGKADAVEDGNFQHGSREEAERDRLETFKMMELHRRRIEGGATGKIDPESVRAGFREEMANAYRDRPQDLDVALGVIDSDEGNMQAVVDQAIAREDPALLNRYLGRMDSQQIEAVITEWNRRHPNGPGLREKLGVGRDNHWSIGNMNGAVFTGDEANTLEQGMMGVPQNPKQQGELALRIVNQQIEQSGAMGRWLCDDEYAKLTEHAKHLRETMGVTDGDVDSNGRIRMRTRDGETFYGNFDRNGQFRPEAMGSGASTALNMLSAGSKIVADNYSQAVDKMASTITTIIAVIGAIVLTVATFGAGASVLVAMAIAAGIGALTIGVNAAMRGGRYSRDDLTRDVVSAAVQIATAGLNVGIARGLAAGGKIAAGGAAAIKAASLSGRIAAHASNHAVKTAMLTQGLMGGMGSFATTALDPAMRRREDWGAQSAHAFFRGFAGGAVTAGISQGLTKGAGALVQRYAASKAVALALQRGASREAAMRLAGMSAAKMASGKFMEVGVRGVINATSATAGKATELGYENLMGVKSHTSGDFYRELRHAFIQNAIQGFGEGMALRGSRRFINAHAEAHAGEVQEARGKASKIAGEAFDREMGRNGMGPQARADGDDPAAPASRPATPDEAARDTVERLPERPRRAANDNEPEGLPTRRAVGDEEPPPLRPHDDDDDGSWRTEHGAGDKDKVRGPGDDPARTSNANAITGEYPALRIPPTLAEHLANPATMHDRIFATADLTPEMLKNLPSIPEKSRIRASDPKSGEAAMANYRALRDADQHREVMLARCVNPKDPQFGEFMVLQGGPGSVGPPPLGWTTDRHAHPMLITSASMAERLTVSLPSGTKGDFSGLRKEVDLVAGLNKSDSAKLESVIDIRLGDTNVETVFSVARHGDQYEYRVSFRPPHDGVEHMGPFYSLADYEQAAFNLTGQVFGAQNRGTKSTPEGTVTSRARGTPVQGEALTASQREDIEFVHQRMVLAGEYEGQMQGRLARGLIDPALGRVASLTDAQTRVELMGLVGKPDSMIRLHNILNDDSIPVPVRALISDATLAATRNHLIRTGQLGWDEPLVMLFHGATPQRTASVVKNGIDMARGPGGPHDDFGQGIYVTQSFETALKYRETRSRTRKGEPPGGVVPYLLRARDLGNRVDVSTGASLRAQWEAFAVANARTLIMGNGPGAKLVATDTVQKIIRGEPIKFTDFDPFMINNRGTLFNDFLTSIGARPDVIFGDLGGPLTNGIQLRQMTNQAAVRSQGIADLMNRQHVRPGTTDADLIRAGVLVDSRNIVQPDGSLVAPEPASPLRTQKPANEKKPPDGSPDDPAELDAMTRSSPHIDEINERQAEFSARSPIGPSASVEAIRRGGPDAAAARRRLDSYYKSPSDAVLVEVSDARISALAAGLQPGKRMEVEIEGGMVLRLYRQRVTEKTPNPPVRYDASVPPRIDGQPHHVWQFSDGELRVWRGPPSGKDDPGKLIQASVIGKGQERKKLEANMFSYGESYKRTKDTPIGPQAGGYHGGRLERGHLHGAGLGVESPFGIGLVPREVNQELQNRGIEQYMRRLRDALPEGVEMIYHTDVEWHKTTNRQSRIGYKIEMVLNGHRERFAEFAINIDADPPGTLQSQRRGTAGRPWVEKMEWPVLTARNGLSEYLIALEHIVKKPDRLEGLGPPRPTREQIGTGLLQLPSAEIKRLASADRGYRLGSFNPPRSQDFKVTTWAKDLNAHLAKSWKRYVVVDMRGLGLKPLQKQQILRALARLTPRDQKRIVLLDDKSAKPLTIPPGYRVLYVAETEDDDI
ncbi:MAG TPA: polymorphic toxin type 4 domain-containing protein [Croceibacterium sp.]